MIYPPEGRWMMLAWADCLDWLNVAVEVMPPFKKRGSVVTALSSTFREFSNTPKMLDDGLGFALHRWRG
jgi:hypothetical protein